MALLELARYLRGLGVPDVITNGAIPVMPTVSSTTYGCNLINNGSVWLWDNPKVNTKKNPYPLRKLMSALANVGSNNGNCKIAWIGDSTTEGCGANGTVLGGARPFSPPVLTGIALGKMTGLAVNQGVLCGNGGTTEHASTLTAYDARCTYGVSWAVTNANTTAGGGLVQTVATAVSVTPADETFTFTPVESWDTCEIYWYDAVTTGTFTVDPGAGSSATLTGINATGILHKSVVTRTLGVGPVILTRTVAPACFVVGIRCYNSTQSSIDILNMGWIGSTAISQSTSALVYNPIPAIKAWAPDMTFINLGINDVINTSSQAAFTTALTALANAALVSGDCCLVVPTPLAASYATQQALIYTAIYTVAHTLSLPVIDLNSLFVSQVAAPQYYYTDLTNLTKNGYQSVANNYTEFLLG